MGQEIEREKQNNVKKDKSRKLKFLWALKPCLQERHNPKQ
jgi:hypothetical protein